MNVTPKSPTSLDRRVAALLTRVGMAGPLSHMQRYTVVRTGDRPSIVVITLIADAEFDAS